MSRCRISADSGYLAVVPCPITTALLVSVPPAETFPPPAAVLITPPVQDMVEPSHFTAPKTEVVPTGRSAPTTVFSPTAPRLPLGGGEEFISCLTPSRSNSKRSRLVIGLPPTISEGKSRHVGHFVPAPAGVAHVPSPLQKVAEGADVRELR